LKLEIAASIHMFIRICRFFTLVLKSTYQVSWLKNNIKTLLPWYLFTVTVYTIPRLHIIIIIFHTFVDTSEGHIIRPNFKALQSSAFSVVGKMLATMIVQGGELPCIFSPSLCQYIQGGIDNAFPEIDEVADIIVRKSLKKVSKSIE
jgi:hypothetical protein